MSFKIVAVFGAEGQIGRRIYNALVESEQQSFGVLAFVPPGTAYTPRRESRNVVRKAVDVTSVTKRDLMMALRGVDVVISALSGEAIEYQGLIQDAAADAGVKRFYPSEYGMHHIYKESGKDWGYVHPMWERKARCNEQALNHPAILSGKMTYTLIGCGEFYNQVREKTWCPWTRKNVDSYTIHIVGDPDAKADYTHLDDFAAYLVASLYEPKKSANTTLNFVSDHISLNEIATLLEKYSGKPVKKDIIPAKDVQSVIADPSQAPQELQDGSGFPVAFWYIIKSLQGEGKFCHPKEQIDNNLFPAVQTTTFEKYFAQQFAT